VLPFVRLDERRGAAGARATSRAFASGLDRRPK
jgi:hypothetical protein